MPPRHRPTTRALSNRRGAAAVEFAVVLPMLTTIVLGCIDFGRYAHTYIAVTNAARSGAGYGSLNPFTNSTQSIWQANVRQSVQDEIAQLNGFDSSKLGVTATQATEADGLRRISVTAQYPFNCVVPWPGVPSQLTLRRTVVMRALR